MTAAAKFRVARGLSIAFGSAAVGSQFIGLCPFDIARGAIIATGSACIGVVVGLSFWMRDVEKRTKGMIENAERMAQIYRQATAAGKDAG